MARALRVLSVVVALLPASALADVVGPCPPLFDASHTGCHFDPSRTEILIGSGVAFFLVVAVVVLLVAFGGKRKGAPPGE